MKTLLIAVLCAVSLPAAAADFDYSYLDLAYSKQSNYFATISGGGGPQLDGSWNLGSTGFALEAAYKHNWSENRRFRHVILESYRVGGEYHWPVNDYLDFVAHADHVEARTTLDGYYDYELSDQTDHGYLLGMGLRAQAMDSLELDAFVDHDDVGFDHREYGSCGLNCRLVHGSQDSTETVLSLAARYRLTEKFGVGFEYRHSSLQIERLLSVRWNF